METDPSGISVSPDGPSTAGGSALGAPDQPDDVEPRPNRGLEFLSRFWAWLFLLVLVVIFSVTGRGFLDLFNFQAIGANMAIMLIMAWGSQSAAIAAPANRNPMRFDSSVTR